MATGRKAAAGSAGRVVADAAAVVQGKRAAAADADAAGLDAGHK